MADSGDDSGMSGATLGALLAAGASLLGGLFKSKADEDMQNKNLAFQQQSVQLAKQEEADRLKQNAFQNQMTGMNNRQTAYQNALGQLMAGIKR